MARAVKRTATRVTKKARGSRTTRVRVKRVMTETSPGEEGDDGNNNQLGAKAAAMARTVVMTTGRTMTTAGRATATGAARAMATGAKRTTARTATMGMMTTMATMVTMATMMPNGDEDNKNQARMAARVTASGSARVMATGAKRATAMTAAMATTATMTPNNDDDASGNKGNKDTKGCRQEQRQWRTMGIANPAEAIAVGDLLVPRTPPLHQWPCHNDLSVIIQLPPTGLTQQRNT
jgi:hypothetical protein